MRLSFDEEESTNSVYDGGLTSLALTGQRDISQEVISGWFSFRQSGLFTADVDSRR